MIRWQAIARKIPLSSNLIIREGKGRGSWKARKIIQEDRDSWRQVFRIMERRHKGTPLWWNQKDDLVDGEPRMVSIHIKVAHWFPRDAMNPHIKGLVDALHERRQLQNTREKNEKLRNYWQGVGVLIDDGPRYVDKAILSYCKVPKNCDRECTMIRIRDAEDYENIDQDMTELLTRPRDIDVLKLVNQPVF